MEVAEPPEIEEGMVRLSVKSCGLAFPDVLQVEGKHFMKQSAPFIPGSEVCGSVIEVGNGVKDLKVRISAKTPRRVRRPNNRRLKHQSRMVVSRCCAGLIPMYLICAGG